MRSSPTPTVLRGHDTVNEIYDRGCDLVEAAMAIRRIAGARDVAPAVPALLACVECALDELANASAALRETSGTATGHSSPGDLPRVHALDDRMRQGLANAELALADARDIAAAACALASRAAAATVEPSHPAPS